MARNMRADSVTFTKSDITQQCQWHIYIMAIPDTQEILTGIQVFALNILQTFLMFNICILFFFNSHNVF